MILRTLARLGALALALVATTAPGRADESPATLDLRAGVGGAPDVLGAYSRGAGHPFVPLFAIDPVTGAVGSNLQHAASLAALKSALITGTGFMVRDGYGVTGDTPSVVYGYATAACTAPDDGMQVAALGGGCWIAQVAGLHGVPVGLWGVSPAASGADNTTRLTAALAAASFGELDFGAGKYTFASGTSATLSSLTSSFTIAGTGSLGTQLDFAAGGLTLTLPSNVLEGVTVRDLSLTTHTVNADDALTFVQVGLLGAPPVSRVERVDCHGSDGILGTAVWRNCINNRGLSNLTIDGLNVTANGARQGNGVTLTGGLATSCTPSTNAIIENVSNSTFYSLAAGVIIGRCVQGVSLFNNQFTNGVTGVLVPAGAPARELNELNLTGGNQFNTTGDAIQVNSPVAGVSVSGGAIFFVASNTCGVRLNVAAYFSITGSRLEAFTSNPNVPPVNTCGVEVGQNVDHVSVGLIANNQYSGLYTGNHLKSTSSEVTVRGNAFDVAVAVKNLDEGHDNFVESNGQLYEPTWVGALGTDASFCVPLPTRTVTAHIAQAPTHLGTTTLVVDDATSVFNGMAVAGPAGTIPANTVVTATDLATAVAIGSVGTTGTLNVGDPITFTDARFATMPIATLTNGAVEAAWGTPVVDYALSDNTKICGNLIGASAGNTARINLHAVGVDRQ